MSNIPKTRDQISSVLSYVSDWLVHHTADGQTWCRPAGRSHDAWPIHHPALRDYFIATYAEQHDHPLRPYAIRTVVAQLHAKAKSLTMPFPDPAVRVAFRADPLTIALDPGNAIPIEITPQGYAVNPDSQFSFLRVRGGTDLPQPAADPLPSALDDFRQLCHFESEQDWRRCLTWLLASFRPSGPFPILILRLILQGPPSSGASQTARMLRSLIDPNHHPLNPLPTSELKLHQLAYQSWVQAFDHLHTLRPAMAAALCRLSSGAAFQPPGPPLWRRLSSLAVKPAEPRFISAFQGEALA